MSAGILFKNIPTKKAIICPKLFITALQNYLKLKNNTDGLHPTVTSNFEDVFTKLSLVISESF